MVASQHQALEQNVHRFVAEYIPSLYELIAALNAARISHYSSGCGVKSVTFELFPAATVVESLIGLLTLDREYRPSAASGLKDFSTSDGYNPGIFFIMYLRRWSGFAKTVMINEGDLPRGIAAAKAHIIIESLIRRLGNIEGPISRSNLRKLEQSSAFVQLMESIGLALASTMHRRSSEIHGKQYNYHKAMSAALGAQAA